MRAFPLYLALVVLLPQCGGGGGADPKTATDRASDGEQSQLSSSSAATADEGEEPEAKSESRGPSCDDGTCSSCGDGICPAGWYCDESAPGGAACSWLKECAEKPSCGCVTKVLGAACKCRDEAGIKVTCS